MMALSTQETDIFLKMIQNFKQTFNEEDEDEKSVIASLDHIAVKLVEVQVSAWLSSEVGHIVLTWL